MFESGSSGFFRVRAHKAFLELSCYNVLVSSGAKSSSSRPGEVNVRPVRREQSCAQFGEVAERFKAAVLKTAKGVTPSWVRIPPSPSAKEVVQKGCRSPRGTWDNIHYTLGLSHVPLHCAGLACLLFEVALWSAGGTVVERVTFPHGVRRSLHSIVQMQFLQNIPHMVANRVFADEQR